MPEGDPEPVERHHPASSLPSPQTPGPVSSLPLWLARLPPDCTVLDGPPRVVGGPRPDAAAAAAATAVSRLRPDPDGGSAKNVGTVSSVLVGVTPRGMLELYLQYGE